MFTIVFLSRCFNPVLVEQVCGLEEKAGVSLPLCALFQIHFVGGYFISPLMCYFKETYL